jgi:ABC-2 type transport system ATP-binding protein
MMLSLCAAYVQVAQTGRLTPAMQRLLANSSPARVADRITAPTLLVQGENDTLFGLDQADANARAIAGNGTTVAVSWYAGGHNGGGLDSATQDRVTGWLQHYLFGTGPVPADAFRYTVAGPPTDSGRARNRTLQLDGYPGLGEPPVPRTAVPLFGPAQTVINPPGGLPAAISSLPGVGSLGAGALGALSAIPGQTARFTSAPVSSTTVVTGSPTITLSVARPAALPGGGAASATDDGSAVLYVSLAAVDGSQATGAGGTSGGASAGGPDLGSSPGGGSDSGGSGTSGSDSAGDSDSGDSSSDSAGDSDSGDAAASVAAAIAGVGGPAGGAVAPVRITDLPADGSAVPVTVHLPAVAFQLRPGQAFQVRVATTDQGYAGSTAPAVYRISLVDGGNAGVLSVPEAGGVRVSAGDLPLGVLIGLIALVVLSLVGLVLAGRVRTSRRRIGQQAGLSTPGVAPSSHNTPAAPGVSRHIRATSPGGVPGGVPGTALGTALETALGGPNSPDPAGPSPLVITGLRKDYPGGVVAVDDVSFRVDRGQVLGLLGPNGAGKTTTLRMVMGLITPTAGDITLFGAPVRPGAEILSRVGSFVEGSGFLPHLSGRTNLELYWRATGRPARDAHLEQALEIADLGRAVERRVKTYSQGMRQRLAIAQAMLGLPDLLLLDEPTNGLDPPQIHAMREVLRRYAATGRTVLISSPLLSEVEQTCSHVVIVNRGRTIAAGTVAEMVAASGEIQLSTDEPERARTVLRRIPGIDGMEITAGGLLVDLAEVPLGDALRALLDAGITVTAAAPRNRLEDVFLDLVGAGTEART